MGNLFYHIQIHPYVKAAWTAASLLYKVRISFDVPPDTETNFIFQVYQKKHEVENDIVDLVEQMKNILSFVNDIDAVEKLKNFCDFIQSVVQTITDCSESIRKYLRSGTSGKQNHQLYFMS